MVFMVLSLHINAQNTTYLCAGSSKTLTASVSGGIAPITYTWAGPGGTTTGANRTVSVTGTYTWTATDATGCNATGTHEVVVEAAPTIGVVASNSCVGSSQTVTATGVPSGYTYSWNLGAGSNPSTSTSASPSVSYSSVGSKIISLTITKAISGIGTGCPATCSWSATTTITVNQLTGNSTCN